MTCRPSGLDGLSRHGVCRAPRSPRPIAVQPSIFPVPCITLNQLMLPCYPSPCLLALSPEVFILSLEAPSSSPGLFPLSALHSFFALFTLSPKSIRQLFCNQQDPRSLLKQPGVWGFFPFWNGATETGGPRICATVAPCGLSSFSRRDRPTRQPNRKFDARVERRPRDGQRRRPAQSLRREAPPPGNTEPREDGEYREARSLEQKLA